MVMVVMLLTVNMIWIWMLLVMVVIMIMIKTTTTMIIVISMTIKVSIAVRRYLFDVVQQGLVLHKYSIDVLPLAWISRVPAFLKSWLPLTAVFQAWHGSSKRREAERLITERDHD